MHPHSVLEEILSRTDIAGAMVYRADEVARWPRPAHERLLELGLLREVERARTVWCDGCGNGCVVHPDLGVDPETGKLRGYYFCRDPENGGPITFDEDEFRRFEFQLAPLARMVAEAIGTQGAVAAVVPDRVYLLGTLPAGGGPLEVFLASGMRLPDAPSVLEHAERLHASGVPVLIVTHNPPPAIPWSGPRPTILSLAELATWNEAHMSIDFSPLVNVLRTLRPPAREETWLTVKDCALLLMKDLPHIELEHAKARVSKAANAGKFTTNGKKRDARRIERTSFDAWRLQQRDRDLDAEDDESRFERVTRPRRRQQRY